jgi:hypothetical protein
MMSYSGEITTYTLSIQTPSVHTNYKSLIYLKGSFGLAFLCFVPEGGSLGTNRKREGSDVFDAYFYYDAWGPMVDTLRNEKPVWFFFDDYDNVIVKTGDEPIGEEEAP